jgi:hypothetical protein
MRRTNTESLEEALSLDDLFSSSKSIETWSSPSSFTLARQHTHSLHGLVAGLEWEPNEREALKEVHRKFLPPELRPTGTASGAQRMLLWVLSGANARRRSEPSSNKITDLPQLART